MNLATFQVGKHTRQVYSVPRKIQKRLSAVRMELESRDWKEDTAVGGGGVVRGGKSFSTKAYKERKGLTSQNLVKLHGIASATMAKGDYEEARVVLTGIARRTPGGSEIYKLLGCLHETMYYDVELPPKVRLKAGEKWYVTKRVEAGILKKDWRAWAGCGYAGMRVGKGVESWRDQGTDEEREAAFKEDLQGSDWFLTAVGDFTTGLSLVRVGGRAWNELQLAVGSAMTRLWSLEVKGSEDAGLDVYRELWDRGEWCKQRRRNGMEKDRGANENYGMVVMHKEGERKGGVDGGDEAWEELNAREVEWEWCVGSGVEVKGWVEIRKRKRREGRKGVKDDVLGGIMSLDGLEGDVNFLATEGWKGRKEGWTFKKGERGLGYYVDCTNPSMPMFWDYEYHKRALDRREAERGEIDKGGRINLSRRREVYERRKKNWIEFKGGGLVKNLLPRGTVAEVIAKTEDYAFQLIREGEYLHCLNVIRWSREVLRRRYRRAIKLKKEYDGKIKAVKGRMWDKEKGKAFKKKEFVLGVLKEDNEDDEEWGFEDEELLLQLKKGDDSDDDDDIEQDKLLEACRLGAMGPAIDGMEGICLVGANKGALIGGEGMRRWTEWLDLGLYKSKAQKGRSPLSQGDVAYQVARAVLSKGHFAGEIGREVVGGLLGPQPGYLGNCAKAIVQIEGIEGGDDEGENDIDALEELGEEEVSFIESLQPDLSGTLQFTANGGFNSIARTLDASRLKAIVVASKWILDECFTENLCARVQRACKNMCITALKKGNWGVDETKGGGGNWDQSNCANKQLLIHHFLRAVVSEGCGGLEDERVVHVYKNLQSKLGGGGDTWKEWAEQVEKGGTVMCEERDKDEFRDDLVSLFVTYAECIVARKGSSEKGLADAVAILTGYMEARSGIEFWDIKGGMILEGGDKEEVVIDKRFNTPIKKGNKRLSERDSFGVVVLTNVKPTRRMGLKVAYMSEETGLRRVATVVGVTGTGSGTSYIVKNEDDEETFTGMGKVFIVLSKMPESRKNAAKVDNRKKRKYIRKENNKRKGSDEDLPDVDMKLEDDEEDEELVVGDDVMEADEDEGEEVATVDLLSSTSRYARQDSTVIFTRDELSPEDLSLKLEHLRTQPRTKAIEARMLATIVMLARDIHDGNVVWAADGVFRATKCLERGGAVWGESAKYGRMIFAGEGIEFPKGGEKGVAVNRRDKRNVGYNVALLLLADVGRRMEWDGWKEVCKAVNWDMEGEAGEWIRATGEREKLVGGEKGYK